MKNFAKKIILSLLFSILLTSCLSTKSLTKIVRDKITNDSIVVNQLDTTYLIVSAKNLQPTDSLVSSVKIKSYFIPAIVLWLKNNTLGCTINNQYFTTIFSNKLTEMSEEFKLKEILNGRKLEISIESVPNRFIYSNKFNFMFLLYIYTYSFQEAIYADNGEFKISYKILEGNSEIKSGVFNINNSINPLINTWSSQTEFIEKYVDKLKYNFEQQSIDIINKIIQDVG